MFRENTQPDPAKAFAEDDIYTSLFGKPKAKEEIFEEEEDIQFLPIPVKVQIPTKHDMQFFRRAAKEQLLAKMNPVRALVWLKALARFIDNSKDKDGLIQLIVDEAYDDFIEQYPARKGEVLGAKVTTLTPKVWTYSQTIQSLEAELAAKKEALKKEEEELKNMKKIEELQGVASYTAGEGGLRVTLP